jgi:thiamine pyrophosphokinase
MKSVVILCNGEFPKKEYPLYLLRTADVIVCCDSRYNIGRLKKLGLEPALIVGDMDSTPRRIQQQYADRLVHLAGQDDNDLSKAFNVVRERWPEASDIYILGASGKEEAHTIGNFGWLMEWERRAMDEFADSKQRGESGRESIGPFTLSQDPTPHSHIEAKGLSSSPCCPKSCFKPKDHSAFPSCFNSCLEAQGLTAPPSCPNSCLEAKGLRVEMVSDYSTAFVVSGFRPMELHVGEGRKMSFFSTDPSLSIRSTGLIWPLEGVDLSKWWAATLNRTDSDIVTLQFSHLSPLLIIMD